MKNWSIFLAVPIFFECLEEFYNSNASKQSRNRIQLIVDDTKSEKFGYCMEFIHKLFDPGKKQYIKGYNYVFVVVVSGHFIFPLYVGLWLPEPHVKHRSKNDMLVDLSYRFKIKSICSEPNLVIRLNNF